MEKEKKTENVKLTGTWFYSVLCLVSRHLSLPYNTIFWLKARTKERKEMYLRKNNSLLAGALR